MSKNEHVDAQTGKNILKAQTYKGKPPSRRLVKEKNISELLERGAKNYPDKRYMIFYDERGARSEYSYGQFNETVNRIANFMKHGLGLKRGDRISTVMYNHPDTIAIYFAIWK